METKRSQGKDSRHPEQVGVGYINDHKSAIERWRQRRDLYPSNAIVVALGDNANRSLCRHGLKSDE